MEPEVQSSSLPKRSKKNVIVISLIIFIAVMLISVCVLSYIMLQSTTVYKGVYVGGLDVSGMGRHDMLQFLEGKYSIPATDVSITLKTQLAELKATYPELGVDYDTNAAVEAAYSIGRTGNIFKRLHDIASAGVGGTVINMPQTYDEEKIDMFINKFSKEAFQEVKEGALLITNDRVVIRSGRHGESVSKDNVKTLITGMIKSNKGGVADPEVIMTYPTPFDADDIYNQLVTEPVNATFKMEDGTLKLVPHTVGKKIDKALLKQIIEEHNMTEDTDRQLPVVLTQPEYTSDNAVSMLFRDELASVYTDYKTVTKNEINRAHNIGLAVSKFDGTILLPGEEFSFNDIVGSRNAKTGYKEAHIYINGRVEDGIGGGICQAVSTIYNAVLDADLTVNERKSHSFIVTYVPLGQDATAYYGGTDFRFINSTQWPLKIDAWLDKNKVHVVFKGTNTEPEKTVHISNKVLSRTPYSIKYVDDPTLPVGTTKKYQYGTDGYVVETFKTIKSGNTVVSQTKLHTSRYKPCTEEILVGIKNPDGTTTPGLAEDLRKKNTPTTPATPVKPTEPTTPVKPADPTEPTTPATPTIPTEPTTPATPTIPTEPQPPQVPDAPVTPELPTKPDAPATPDLPVPPEASEN